MKRSLPLALREVLRLIVDGYTHEAISVELNLSKSSVDTYVKRLKEYFANEPELRSDQFSSTAALVLIGQRYFKQDTSLHKAAALPEARKLLSAGGSAWKGLVESRELAVAAVNYKLATEQLKEQLRDVDAQKGLDRFLLGYYLQELANYEAMIGETEEAIIHADRSLQIFKILLQKQPSMQLEQGLVRAYMMRLQTADLGQRTHDAQTYYRLLLPLAEQVGDSYALVKGNFSMAQVYFNLGAFDKAREYATQSYATLSKLSAPRNTWFKFRDTYFAIAWWKVMCPVLLGDIYVRLNMPREAEFFYDLGEENRLAAWHLADLVCPPFTGTYTWLLLCKQGKIDDAERYLNQIEVNLSRLGFAPRQAMAAMCRGDFLRDYKKDQKEAQRAYQRGLDIATKASMTNLQIQLAERLAN